MANGKNCAVFHTSAKFGVLIPATIYFNLAEQRVLEEAAGCKSYFALTLIRQNRDFQAYREMFTKYLSLEDNEFILAFQLQFGTYEAEIEHFRWEKEKRHFNEWFSR